MLCAPALAADKPPQPTPPDDPPGIVRMNPDAQRSIGLKVERAGRGRITQPVQAPGTVAFDEGHVARLRPLAQGRVLRLLAAPGDAARTGQPLAELDTPSLSDARDTLAAAQASLRQAQAELGVAEAAQQRGETLARDGSLSRAEAERRRAETARARAAVDTARAAATSGEARVTRLGPLQGGQPGIVALASPLDGVVVSVGVTPGEVVDAGAEAFVVADLSVVIVLAQVAEGDAALVQVGDPAEVRLTSGPARTWAGRVVSLGAQLDPRSRTLTARVSLGNPDGTLRAGMLAQVTLTADRGRDGTEIPAAAVQSVDSKPVAFVKAGEDRFERRDLTLGVQRPDWVEVRDGVRDGEEVVTDGSFQLKAVLQRDLLGSTD